MVLSEDWRPGSFTKNFSWGDKAAGLKQLHEIIRIGFSDRMEDVPRAVFRERAANSGRPDYIPINFFLFNKIENGNDYIIADELVFQALNFDHSSDFDRLGLFAFNFSYAGRWRGAEAYQRRPALWAYHYVADRVAQLFDWTAKRITADDIENFVESDDRYHAKTARKLATNLNYLFQIGKLKDFREARVSKWWVNALFLALDRIIEDRKIDDRSSPASRWPVLLDRAGFQFVSGRRSIEKDLATRHLLRLYDACGARTRFAEDDVRERQRLLVPEMAAWIANQPGPIAALHLSNPRIIKTIPRACAMLARYQAGFLNLDLDDLENLNLEQFIRDETAKALSRLVEDGVTPTMSAEELLKLTRGR